MPFTVAEKLQIAMLCDLARSPEKREVDFGFIYEAVTNDDLWAINWRYSGLQLNVESPPEVKLVCDILDMWDRLERDYVELSPVEQARVGEESHRGHPPQFLGFDGNNETDLLHIARLLINDLDRWSGFKGRDLNSHMPSIDSYRRMLSIWRPLWDRKVAQHGGYEFTADEIIAILRERIHPERRKPNPDGTWTFEPANTQA
jgi:uncharacterized protein YfbU (UPF0304 family)